MLVGDGDDVADELPDGVVEPGHAPGQVAQRVDLRPEGLELAHLQQVGQELQENH